MSADSKQQGLAWVRAIVFTQLSWCKGAPACCITASGMTLVQYDQQAYDLHKDIKADF